MRIKERIEEKLRIRDIKKEERKERVKEMMSMVRLKKEKGKRYKNEI